MGVHISSFSANHFIESGGQVRLLTAFLSWSVEANLRVSIVIGKTGTQACKPALERKNL